MGARGVIGRRSLIGGGAALAAFPLSARTARAATWSDRTLPGSDGRAVSVRIAYPHRPNPRRALILLSHGANGSFEGLVPLMTALARTHIVAAPLHTDAETHAQFRKLAPADVWRTRIEDMNLLVAQAPELAPRARVVAMGHSYGALVAQALGGAAVFGQASPKADVAAVVAISPPGPLPGFVDSTGWARMTVPQLVTTGDMDVVPIIAPTWQAHLASFEAARVPGSCAWVGRGVDHYFGRNIHRLTREAIDQRAQFEAMIDISTRFVSAHAEGDVRSRRWLAASGPLRSYPKETLSWTWRG